MAQRSGFSRIAAVGITAGVTIVVLTGIFMVVGSGWPMSALDVRIVVKAGCPAVLLGQSNATEDFADVVSWQGRMYQRVEAGWSDRRGPDLPVPLPRGDKIGEVACNVTDSSSTKGNRVAPGPWPDGTSTGLPKGTQLYAIDGLAPACALVAEVDGELLPYLTYDDSTGQYSRC